ncbi:aryl-alcohol oxidase precursor [Desarmillaria tabescens]|uniref:Aryl-alcohol oxidase n=1 Tax=Armillaria tabescens TaxID=1929756 RepID=A0AA39TYW3_ARMTA|nr:aryl-alcohol oxidase precursor [Desarmillaria tabescens]KAK0470383.1 aryl-alcohol oxidase precursor [Desarmillaria tabescens]
MVLFVFVLLILCNIALGAIYGSIDDLPTRRFHYIIIGGGGAGNVLANRLTEDSHISVLVLEAGESTADVLLSQVPFFSSRLSGSSLDWNFTTTEQPGLNGRSIPFSRGFGLGGSSAINGMSYIRGSSQDYDRYARVSGDPGWAWDQMQRYLRKNERFVAPADHHNTTGQFDPKVHGFNGITFVSLPGYPRATDERVIQTTADLSSQFPFNLDYNSGYQLGIGWAPLTVGNGTRSSSQTSYLGPGYINRPNLHVLIHARVTRILDIKKGRKPPLFNAVEFTQDAGATMHVLAPSSLREIILSAGSIGTPHILLHSGVGDDSELATLGIASTLNLPDVGRNLSDQVLWTVPFTVNSTNTIENIYYRNVTFQEETLAEWKSNQTGFLTVSVANQRGFFRIPEDTGVLDGEPCAGNETAHYELSFVNGINSNPPPEVGNFFVIAPAVLCPLSRGAVTINSTNPLDAPVINPNYLSHAQDLDIMKFAVEGAKKFVTGPAWDGYILDIATNTTDQDIRNGASNLNHAVGTASMSPVGADWGVVDPDLRMKGARGVRIADASVLPFVPAGHTQTAVYIFAERAADLIKASAGM